MEAIMETPGVKHHLKEFLLQKLLILSETHTEPISITIRSRVPALD